MTELDVAVNLLWCDPGRVGGSEQYLVRQLDGLGRHDDVDAVLHCVPAFARAHAELAPPHRMVEAPIDGRRRPRRVLAEHRWFPRASRDADIVHHGGGTMPANERRPALLTVHDLQYLELPHYWSRTKRRYLGLVVPRSIARATLVAVPSEFVRGTVVEAYGVDPERVVVVRHGFEARSTTFDATDVRRRYGLGERPYVVLPGITHPHKGHRFILDVLADAWTEPDLRLVLLGAAGSADDAVRRRIGELGLGRRVLLPGRVTEHDRDALIAGADAVVFPTEYEGFGAPVLEAMVLGTPVICSTQPAVVEVVADAAVVRPLVVEDWADALAEARRRRADLVARGRARARRYSIEASGDDLAAAYRRVAGIGGAT
jgi:alpha-1,3-rhamnosyl/mannosyltransferase